MNSSKSSSKSQLKLLCLFLLVLLFEAPTLVSSFVVVREVVRLRQQSQSQQPQQQQQRPAFSFSSLATTTAATSSSCSSSKTRSLQRWMSSSSLSSSSSDSADVVEEDVDEILLDCEDRMIKSVDSVRQNLSTIRTGRASANMLDRIKADYYGVETPLNQMASISVPSAQQLTISPYDKSQLSKIERSIMESGLGLNPNNDGSVIRINIPALTEDRRKDMLKQCRAIGEEGKVAVRNIRRDGVDAIKKMEKSGNLSEDEKKDCLDEMQKMTDKKTKEIDDVVASKEKDVMKV